MEKNINNSIFTHNFSWMLLCIAMESLRCVFVCMQTSLPDVTLMGLNTDGTGERCVHFPITSGYHF